MPAPKPHAHIVGTGSLHCSTSTYISDAHGTRK